MFKYLLLILSVVAVQVQAAENVKETRKFVGQKLNETVVELKQNFKDTDSKNNEIKNDVTNLNSVTDLLVNHSTDDEINITVLPQGKKLMKVCTNKQELKWKDDSWYCADIILKTDCVKSSDEYQYEETITKDGKTVTNVVCAKSNKNSSINYYWEHRGYASSCGSDKQKAKVYSCYYKDKLGNAMEVAVSYCSNKSKPHAEDRFCYANWQVGPWSSGNAPDSCDRGCNYTVTRSVYCPTNHICKGTKPISSKGMHKSGRGGNTEGGGYY